MVKAVVKPKVSKEEREFRDSKFSDLKEIVNKKNLLCTSCNVSVKQTILRGKVKVHPYLDTLLCDKCFAFYGDGEFSVDEDDGSDKYCRWCGQGGTLYLCSFCTGGFCKKCIKRNLSRSELKSVERDDWRCFCCDVKPLYELRALCWAASTYVEENTTQDESDKKKKKRKPSVSEDSEEDVKEVSDDAQSGSESEKNKKISKKPEAKASSKSPSSRMEIKKIRALITKINSVAQDAIKMCDLSKGKLSDLKKKKITTRFIKDEETALAVSTKLVNSLASMETLTGKFKAIVEDYVKQWSALDLNKETNGDVDDEKEEREDIEEKSDKSKGNDSDDSSPSSKKVNEKKKASKTQSKKKEENLEGDDTESRNNDSDESIRKKSSRRTLSTDSKEGGRRKSTIVKDDCRQSDGDEKSLKRRAETSSSVDSSDEAPKRKRSKRDAKNDISDLDKSAILESNDDNVAAKGEEVTESPDAPVKGD